VYQADNRGGGGQSERDEAKAPCRYLATAVPVIPVSELIERDDRDTDKKGCCERAESEREHAERADVGHVGWIWCCACGVVMLNVTDGTKIQLKRGTAKISQM